tara:strand:+ start:5183 stop:5416 length:234 start_codon:yes stop_codon:yes gene_type:complete
MSKENRQHTRVVTVWTKRWKSGKTKRCIYQTKSHTDMHRRLRDENEGRTWINPIRVTTHFTFGLPLDEPLVFGGEEV